MSLLDLVVKTEELSFMNYSMLWVAGMNRVDLTETSSSPSTWEMSAVVS